MSQQSRRGSEWETTRLRILNRDGWVCGYCGDPLEGSNATVDHIVAIAHGGTDDDTNLISACRSCNGRKSDRMLVRMTWFNTRWVAGVR